MSSIELVQYQKSLRAVYRSSENKCIFSGFVYKPFKDKEVISYLVYWKSEQNEQKY